MTMGFCRNKVGSTGFEPSCARPLALQFPHGHLKLGGFGARRSDDTDARYSQARKAPTRSILKRAHVRQPRTTAVSPAFGCSRDRNEEQDSGLLSPRCNETKKETVLFAFGGERSRNKKLMVVALA